MATSYAEKFIYSIDTGITWSPVETPDNSAIFDLDFADTTYGFACGVNGVILKYDRTKSSVINSNQELAERNFNLYQNYPNPFNPRTVIRYSLSENQNTSLKIYDVLGNEVVSLVNEKQNSGSYNIEFDGTNLPSGIYFYKITSGKYSAVKRMVLIK